MTDIGKDDIHNLMIVTWKENNDTTAQTFSLLLLYIMIGEIMIGIRVGIINTDVANCFTLT